MMLASDRDPSRPAAAMVLETGKRLDQLVTHRMPRLELLCGRLRQQAADWNGAALERALQAHLAALAGLDVTLLVAPGLRAGPLERHEAAFRRQAAAVADCTEVTWGAVKDFVEAGARETVDSEELVSDFVMEARAIQRQSADARGTAAALLADVHAREASASEAARAGWAALAVKAAALLQRVDAIDDVCAASHRVQSTTYRIRDERTVLVGSLRNLAQGLGRGLLDRLRPLIGNSDCSAPGDLQRADEARQQLAAALQDAQGHLRRLQASHAALATVLHAVGERARRLG